MLSFLSGNPRSFVVCDLSTCSVGQQPMHIYTVAIIVVNSSGWFVRLACSARITVVVTIVVIMRSRKSACSWPAAHTAAVSPETQSINNCALDTIRKSRHVETVKRVGNNYLLLSTRVDCSVTFRTSHTASGDVATLVQHVVVCGMAPAGHDQCAPSPCGVRALSVKNATRGGAVNGSDASKTFQAAKWGVSVCAMKPALLTYCSKKWNVFGVCSSSP